MRIKTAYIENFRGYKNRVDIDFEALTAFVGRNDAGKSTVLEALDIFFNEGKNIIKIEKEDVCIYGDSDVFTIGVCFDNYPSKIIVDSTVETSVFCKTFLHNIAKKKYTPLRLKFFSDYFGLDRACLSRKLSPVKLKMCA